jgi:hypothetical protein
MAKSAGWVPVTVNHQGEGSNPSFATAPEFDPNPAKYKQGSVMGVWPDREALALQASICGFESHRLHMKTCNLCKELKSESEFYKSLGRIRLQCKSCLVLKQTAPKYGLTYEELLAMYEKQNHACKICFRVTSLVVDHDHKCCPTPEKGRSKSCGKCVRGLICRACNHGLGNFEDNPERLQNAIKYLGI